MCNITFDNQECMHLSKTIDLLGNRISEVSLKPNPERMKPLLKLLAIYILRSFRKKIGMFAYYT